MTVPISEKQHQKTIIELAQRHGFRVAHFPTSRTQSGGWATAVQADGKGFPDLYCLRERPVIIEVKMPKGRLSRAQAEWLLALMDAGQEAYIIRPQDLDDLGKVLAHRGDPWGRRSHVAAFAARLLKGSRGECVKTLGKAA